MRGTVASIVTAATLVAGAPAPSWTPQTSGVTSRLRGVSAVSTSVAWASGSAGTVIRTEDGGKTWRTLTVPDAEKLDFRDIDALDAQTAYVLSIGPGDASRIYKTTDAGATWALQFRNEDPKAFFDAMAFRDARRGVAFSDSVDKRTVILRTDDGGANWTPHTAGEPACRARRRRSLRRERQQRRDPWLAYLDRHDRVSSPAFVRRWSHMAGGPDASADRTFRRHLLGGVSRRRTRHRGRRRLQAGISGGGQRRVHERRRPHVDPVQRADRIPLGRRLRPGVEPHARGGRAIRR